MDTKWKLTDVLIICATILGPVLAVQAQKFLERMREKRQACLRIFEALMSTRSTRIAPEHVRAINSVQLAFLSNKDKAVREALDIYIERLNMRVGDNPSEALILDWSTRRDAAFVDLLYEMSKNLGFGFTRVQIEKGAYYPQAHVDVEENQQAILRGVANIFKNGEPLPVQFIVPTEAAELQAKVQEATLRLSDPERVTKVKLVD